MYIKTDYKDEYFRYLQDVGYSANTVRNLRSDMNSLYVWLRALNFQVAVSSLYDEYQRHLIGNGTPFHTMNRKLSSLNKFIHWVNLEHPFLTPSSNETLHLDSQKDLNSPDVSDKSRRKLFRNSAKFFAILVLVLLIPGIVFLLQNSYPSDIAKKTNNDDHNESNTEYVLQFDLAFNSPIRASNKSISTIMFKFYMQNDQTQSIGYVECPLLGTTIMEGSSRLKVQLDRHCSPIPSKLTDTIARNEAILADIYLNSRKLSTQKVLLIYNQIPNRSLSYQGEMMNGLSKASMTSDLLPSDQNSGNVLGFETASLSAKLGESIPLSVFQNPTPLDDGDIVSIYNNEIVRALLSTKILGVKSSDRIITHGVAYVHIVNTLDSPISEGDYISTSTTPGFGQKATNKYDSIVGIALEPYTPGNSFLKVLITNQ